MRILVIGGTRFIGPYVVRQIVEAGHQVMVYHRGRNESAVLPDAARHVRHDDASMPVIRFTDDVLRYDPEVVIHMMLMGEPDANAAMDAFRGIARRLVAVSSGDVYRAYGRFSGIEPGPLEDGPLSEDSPLRATLHAYRAMASSPDALEYWYEKILVERAVLNDPELAGVVLRLPKVYGPGDNADLATMYAFRNHPQWRWTHGYVENVAAAVALAALHPATEGRIYNVGEERTPTVAERVADLPPSPVEPVRDGSFNFGQDLVYDTTRIRSELGYSEPVSYEEGLTRTLGRR